MATPKGQRIGIWIIAIALCVGTLGGFAVMILGTGNAKIDQAAQQKAVADQTAQQEAASIAHAASSKPLDGYSAAAFDKASVTALGVEVVKEGDGAAVAADSTIVADYFGWTSDGKIFDSTNQDGTNTSATFSLAQVIQGWTKGLNGVRVGSTVKLTIPADLAYGTAGSPPTIGASEPLQFIVTVKSIK
ncbi:MAG: FKBP-type peptidyl-prolyl cis-trans isomerase [Candidatus Saccharimonadales bacterium]